MALSFRHARTSVRADGPDPTQLQPSDWLAEHSLTCASGVVLGRATVGTGAVEELASLPSSFVGLGNVENKSSATIRDEITAANITTPLGYVPTSVVGLTGSQSVAAFKTGLLLSSADVGLGNVENKSSATIRGEITSANITTPLGYVPTSVVGLTGSQSVAAFKTGLSLVSSDVGLGNVNNTSDVNKPVSTAQQTALNLKENSIAAGTTAQYWRGDKSWQTLDKTAVGLGNVENKSSATIRGEITSGDVTTALTYTPTSVTGLTGTQSVAAFKTGLSLVKGDVGLGNVDNTSDANKPVSTAQQTALNLKADLTGAAFTGAVSIASGSLAANAPGWTLSQTWNNSGVTFKGITVDITDTASASGSLFVDWRKSGSSVASIRKDGLLTCAFTVISGGSSGANICFNHGGIALAGDSFISFASPGAGIGTTRAILIQDANYILHLRNGTNAHGLRIGNTYTDASNNEYFGIDFTTTANVATIGPKANGTGTLRAVTAVGAWTFSSALNTSAAITIGGGSNLNLGSAGGIYWSSRSSITGPTDGNLILKNNAGTSFAMLQWGGTTASFAGLKLSSTTLQSKLADDSAFAPLQGKLTTDTAYAAGVVVPTGTITLYDSTGTAYRVPCLV